VEFRMSPHFPHRCLLLHRMLEVSRVCHSSFIE
jgi:hypothetical protein